METIIKLAKRALKGYDKAPKSVRLKFDDWYTAVRTTGLERANQSRKGYRPHPLTGQRQGQWAVCLNDTWRVVYEVDNQGCIIVTVLEVTPHDYRTR